MSSIRKSGDPSVSIELPLSSILLIPSVISAASLICGVLGVSIFGIPETLVLII